MNERRHRVDIIATQQMRCEQLVEIVTDYLEDSLSARDRLVFEAHIDACHGCRHHLDQVRMTIQVVGSLGEDDWPADARERLLSAFRTWSRVEA